MTIDEAIRHCEEVAGEQQERADSAELIDILDGLDVEACKECAADHRQLAEWLTELQELRCRVMRDDPLIEATITMLDTELKEAKRLLKLAVEDFKAVNSNMLTCRYCKHYDAGIDDCGLSDDDSACEDICGWRYADEVKKLINDEK